MTIRSMEIFMAVYTARSMSRAAENLHITQPTISQTVKELEQQYNTPLFYRLGKKLHVTPQGEILAGHIRKILSQVQQMEEGMNLLQESQLGAGATVTVGQALMAQTLCLLQHSHPGISTQVMVDNTQVIESLLLDSRLDLAFVEGSIKSSQLVCLPLCRDELVLVCPPDHPLAGLAPVRLEDLPHWPFLMREEGSGTRELFEQALQQQDLQVPVIWTSHGFDSILSAAKMGLGITVMSRRAAQDSIARRELVAKPIQGARLARNFCLVYHKNRTLSQGMQALVTCFRKAAGQDALAPPQIT